MSKWTEALRRSWWLAALLVPTVSFGAGPFLEPHPARSDNYGESFTFIADLEDGTYVWTQFSFTHLGPGSNHAVCRALVVAPGRESWTPNERVKKSDWWYDRNHRALKLGNCYAHESASPEIKLGFPDGRLTLKFARPLTPFTPPGTAINKGDDRYRASVLIPHSPVEATLVVPGQGTRSLKGGGYADHSHSTWAPGRLAKQWVRFRALNAAPYTLIVGRESLEGGFGPVYLLEDDAAPAAFARFDLHRSGKGSATGWKVLLSGKSGKAALRSTRLLFRSAPVQELGLLGSMVKPIVGSPVTYTHRAVLERDGRPPLEGIMEVTLEEE